MGLTKYRRPNLGWVNSQKMQKELEQIAKQLNPNENATVKSVIRVLDENGGLPADCPAR